MPVIPLKFSKSGNEALEEMYALHYVNQIYQSEK